MLESIVWEARLSDRNHLAVGAYGEQIGRRLFEQNGYTVEESKLGSKCGDLKVIDPNTGEFWKVEVKTARRGAGGLYQFCLRRDGNMTDCGHSDYVLLLPALKSGRCVPFLIPSAALVGLKKLCIRNHPEEYKGKWREFRRLHGLKLH